MRFQGWGKEEINENRRHYGKYTHVSDNGTIFSSSAIESLLLDNDEMIGGDHNDRNRGFQNFITEDGTIFSSSFASQQNGRARGLHEQDGANCARLMYDNYISESGNMFSSSFNHGLNHFNEHCDKSNVEDDQHSSSWCNQQGSLSDSFFEAHYDANALSGGRRSFRRDRRATKIKKRNNEEQVEQVALLPKKISFVDSQAKKSTRSKPLLTIPERGKLLRCVHLCANGDCAGMKVKVIDDDTTVPKLVMVCSENKSFDMDWFNSSDNDEQSLTSKDTIQPRYWNRTMWEQDCKDNLETSPKISRSPWNCKLWSDGSYDKKVNIQKSDARDVKSIDEYEGRNDEDSETYFYKVWNESMESNSIILKSADDCDVAENNNLDEGEDRKEGKKKLWRKCFIKNSYKQGADFESERYRQGGNGEESEHEQDVLATLFWPDGFGNSDEGIFQSLFWPIMGDTYNENEVQTNDYQQKSRKEEIKERKIDADYDVERTNCVNSLCVKPNDAKNGSAVKSKAESNCGDHKNSVLVGRRLCKPGTSEKLHKRNSSVEKSMIVTNEDTLNCMEFLSRSQKWGSLQEGSIEKHRKVGKTSSETCMESLTTKLYPDENMVLEKLEELFLGGTDVRFERDSTGKGAKVNSGKRWKKQKKP